MEIRICNEISFHVKFAMDYTNLLVRNIYAEITGSKRNEFPFLTNL